MWLSLAEASGRQLRKRKKSVEYYPEPETDASDTDDAEQSQSSASSPSPSPVKPRRRSAKKQRDQQPSHPGKLPANWAQCPCCNQSFPMVIFNDHLDRCAALCLQIGLLSGLQAHLQTVERLSVPKILSALEKL